MPRPSQLKTVLMGFFLVGIELLSGLGRSEESNQELNPKGRSGFMSIQGLGPGMSGLVSTDPDKSGDMGPTIVVDGKVGGHITEHFAVHLYTNLTIRDFETIKKYYKWLFSNDDWLLISWPLIFFGPFAGTNILNAAPGVTWYLSPNPPSFYCEGGGGVGLFIDGPKGTLILGATLNAGVGFEITQKLGVGARVLWSPPAFQSRYTPGHGHVFAFNVVLELH